MFETLSAVPLAVLSVVLVILLGIEKLEEENS